jgi:predicted ChrR family anti-sigma factor
VSLLLDCSQVMDHLQDLQEGTLPWNLSLRLQLHLASCRACQVLLSTLRAVPHLVARLIREEAVSTGPEARAALAWAVARLGEARPEREPLTQVPDPVQPLLKREMDEPLRLLALAHRKFHSVVPRETEPLLPQEVAAELPHRDAWRWHRQGRLRVAELLRDEAKGTTLALMFAPAGYQMPVHSHRGTESLLLLDGTMSDAHGAYAVGQWVHFQDGSEHAPVMGEDGCWCLVREEGTQHFEGPLGWFRNWLAA